MTAAKEGQLSMKVIKGEMIERRCRRKWLNKMLRNEVDRRGVLGLLVPKRDKCNRMLDWLAGALAVLEMTLLDFSSERNSGKGRPLSAETLAIYAAMDEALKEDPSLKDKALRDRVWENLDEQGFENIANAKIQRVIRERKVPSVE